MTCRAILALLLLLAPGTLPARADGEIKSPQLGNVFTQGEPVSLALRADAGTAHWSAHDFFGNEVASGTTSLVAGTASILPGIAATGYFTFDVSLDRGGPLHTALAILPRPGAAGRNSPFGVVTHFAKDWPTDIVPLIAKAGIRRIRDEQPWRKVEKQRGQYQFPPRLSGYMGELAAQGIDPLIMLAFSNPLYDGDKTPYDDDGRAGYAAYAKAVAQHYAGQVSAVEVWNEYNGSFCDGPCRGDRPGAYTAMLKDTYKALKSANPSLTVAGGAAVPIPLDFFEALFKDGALDAMDAVVIHPYRKVPEGVEDKIEDLRKSMQHYGKVKPIWVTEFSDLGDMHKNRDDEARYLVRMTTLLLAAKVDRLYWYLMKDFQEFAGLGLVRSESDPLGRYVPTPAYAAYANLIHQLDGARFVRRETAAPDMLVYLFAQGGNEVRVAWSVAGAGSYQLHAETAQQVDMMGNAKALTAQRGVIAVPLGPNPVYLISAASP